MPNIQTINTNIPQNKVDLKEEIFVTGTLTDDSNREFYFEVPAITNEDGTVDQIATEQKLYEVLAQLVFT